MKTLPRFVSLLAACLVCQPFGLDAAEPAKPNIIVILVDDMAWALRAHVEPAPDGARRADEAKPKSDRKGTKKGKNTL